MIAEDDKTTVTGTPAGPLVELADLTLHVARKLRGYPLQHPDVAPLSPLECLALLYVNRHPGVSPTQLARELALTSSNAATAVRGLVAKGQLERHPDPVDGRGACLHLTESAEQAILIVHRTWRDVLGAARLPEDDLLTTVRTLAAIDAVLVEP